MWTKQIEQIELVPYRATKISRKTQKHLFFPLIAKLVCFSCVFCVRLRETSQKIQGKRVIRTQDLSILNEYTSDWDTNDLQTKMKFRRTLYLLTNKKESVVLGFFTFESSTTNLRHMLGLYVSLRNTRKKLLFYLVIRNEFYLFRSQINNLSLVCNVGTVESIWKQEFVCSSKMSIAEMFLFF